MEKAFVGSDLLKGIRETVINLQPQQNREKLSIRENSEEEEKINKLKTAKKEAMELARFVFVRAGALISIAIPTLLYIAGASVQTIIEGTFISFISLAVYTGASAVGFYYGCKREIEKGKKERK
jgi:hypothetical protein